MALLLKSEHASQTEDFDSDPKIVKFVVVKKPEEQDQSLKGEVASFEEALLPHLDAAHNLARWLLRNEQDAQDVVQEAYLRAFRSFGGFRGGNGRAWLLTIVRNTAYSWMNKQAADEKLVPYDEEKHGEVVSFDLSAKEIVSEKRKEYLHNALLRLSAEFS